MMTMILAKEFEGSMWVLAKDHQAALEQQAAVIEQMREALQKFGNEDTEWFSCDWYAKALALQACPEVLNKVRADAVRKAARDGFEGHSLAWLLDYADHIEKGEA